MQALSRNCAEKNPKIPREAATNPGTRPKSDEEIFDKYYRPIEVEAQGASSSEGDCHESVLDDVFERYGPLEVEAFIDLQFKNALRGEEELCSSNQGEGQVIGSKLEVENVEEDGTSTQINLDHKISLASLQEELKSDVVCSHCRSVWEKDGLVDCRTFHGDNKVNRKTTTLWTSQEKASGCDGGIEMRGVYYNVICFCSCLIARLNITKRV